MKIAQAAKACGVSVRMLRYYEEQGLIRPGRGSSGYREYSEAEVETVIRIQALNRSGLTLAAIAPILPCVGEGRPKLCERYLVTLSDRLSELDRQIKLLGEQRRAIADTLRTQ